MQQYKQPRIPSYYYSTSPSKIKPKQRDSNKKLRLVVVGLLVIGIVVVSAWHTLTPKHTVRARTQTVISTATVKPLAPQKQTITAAAMSDQINAIIAANKDVEISISMTSADGKESYHFGLSPDVTYEAASIGKLITATDYLHEVEQGKRQLSDILDDGHTASKDLESMIVESDNSAWQQLNSVLSHTDLSAFAKSVGMDSYDADSNQITPDDILTLLSKLNNNSLLNQKNTQIMLGWMARANRTDYILAAVPGGVSAYHKAGWVEDRAHDAAIITDGNKTYLLVIFTNGHGYTHATDRPLLLQQLAKPTLAHYIGS